MARIKRRRRSPGISRVRKDEAEAVDCFETSRGGGGGGASSTQPYAYPYSDFSKCSLHCSLAQAIFTVSSVSVINL